MTENNISVVSAVLNLKACSDALMSWSDSNPFRPGTREQLACLCLDALRVIAEHTAEIADNNLVDALSKTTTLADATASIEVEGFYADNTISNLAIMLAEHVSELLKQLPDGLEELDRGKPSPEKLMVERINRVVAPA